MFKSARIKLTLWYLLIIATISVFFSIAMYRVLTAELDRVEQRQRIRIESGIGFPPRVFIIDRDLIEEAKNRLKLFLAGIDLFILGGSAAAGYFLAGRTLKPIKQMVDEQNRFVSDASHELRTPLTSLKSEIEVNLRDKKLTLAGVKKLLESNLEEVNNLQVLSDDLIKLAQYQKPNDRHSFENLNLVSITKEAVKKVEKIAERKKIKIINETKDFFLEGEKQSIIELLVILLDNAVKYSQTGERIWITSEKNDGNLFISVTDEGIGIAEKDIPRLFDRFYRTDRARTKSGASGYGLGLSIAKKIVGIYNGSIEVKSKLNEGSTFIVRLPMKQPSSIKKSFFSVNPQPDNDNIN